jgi:hypothetical protein
VPTVRIDAEVLDGLKKLAEPFVDTPSSVIRKLLEEKGVLAAKEKRGAPQSDTEREDGLTAQTIYEQYLLVVLEQKFNGRGHKRDVTQSVLEKMRANGLLGPRDLELVATGETKAENTVSWGRNALKERGHISRHSARGIWELTPEGRVAAKQVRLTKTSG